MYICVYTHIYMYIHTYTHTHTQNSETDIQKTFVVDIIITLDKLKSPFYFEIKVFGSSKKVTGSHDRETLHHVVLQVQQLLISLTPAARGHLSVQQIN